MQAPYPFIPTVNPELDNMATKAYAAKAKSGTPLACSLDSFRTTIHTLHHRLPKSPKQSDLDALASELSSNKPLLFGKENGNMEKENVKAGTNSGAAAVEAGASAGSVDGNGVGGGRGTGGGGGGGKKEVDQAVMQVLYKYFGFDCGVESRRGSPDLS